MPCIAVQRAYALPSGAGGGGCGGGARGRAATDGQHGGSPGPVCGHGHQPGPVSLRGHHHDLRVAVHGRARGHAGRWLSA